MSYLEFCKMLLKNHGMKKFNHLPRHARQAMRAFTKAISASEKRLKQMETIEVYPTPPQIGRPSIYEYQRSHKSDKTYATPPGQWGTLQSTTAPTVPSDFIIIDETANISLDNIQISTTDTTSRTDDIESSNLIDGCEWIW